MSEIKISDCSFSIDGPYRAGEAGLFFRISLFSTMIESVEVPQAQFPNLFEALEIVQEAMEKDNQAKGPSSAKATEGKGTKGGKRDE